MDLELMTNTSIEINKARRNYQNFKNKFEDFKSKFFKAKEEYTYSKKMEEMKETTRREEETSMSHFNSELVQKKSLITVEMSRTDNKIQNALRSAVEAESISKNVMVDLENQTLQIKNTKIQVGELNKSLETSGNIITRIMNRENRNKAIIGVFSVTLLSIFILMLFSKFTN